MESKIEQIAELFDVKLEQEFYLESYDRTRFKFVKSEGLLSFNVFGSTWNPVNPALFVAILLGRVKVKKEY